MQAIKDFLKKTGGQYKICFSSKRYIFSFVLGIVLLAASLIINVYAVRYATASVSNPVTDIVLSNIGPYDVDGLFVNGAAGMVLFIIVIGLLWPSRLPFMLKTIAIFVMTRSVFISLTHIGAFPTHSTINPYTQNLLEDIIGTKLYSSFFLGDDSFFSGHTGLPFLMAFLYWDRRWIRDFFIVLSVVLGIVVLLGHLHYSIDVLSAFFISYGVYRMARHLFATDVPESLKTDSTHARM
ncbi:MAG: hypothetical protein KGJ35_00125 [Patescibacteria group bacterium]|nr:hypothetical protein [Patescibacteria group bacterium]